MKWFMCVFLCTKHPIWSCGRACWLHKGKAHAGRLSGLFSSLSLWNLEPCAMHAQLQKTYGWNLEVKKLLTNGKKVQGSSWYSVVQLWMGEKICFKKKKNWRLSESRWVGGAMRCFSDGTATTARKWGKPANKNLTPKNVVARDKVRISKEKRFNDRPNRNSEHCCSLPPTHGKVGEMEKRLTHDSQPFAFKWALRTFPNVGVNSSSSEVCRIEYKPQQYWKSVFLAGETNYGLAVGGFGVGGRGWKCWKRTPGSSATTQPWKDLWNNVFFR